MVQREKKFEAKFKARLGMDARDDKAVRILNRVVERTPEGLNYEADQRRRHYSAKVGAKDQCGYSCSGQT